MTINFKDFKQKKFSLDVTMPFTSSDGSEVVLPMVILTGSEMMAAKESAEKATIKMYGGKLPKRDEASSYAELYEENLCWQLIYYSVRHPDDLEKKFFPEIGAVYDMLVPDQAGILKNCYLTLQINQPFLMHLDNDDPEKTEALIKGLMQNSKSAHFELESLTSVGKNILINTLVARLAALVPDNAEEENPEDDELVVMESDDESVL